MNWTKASAIAQVLSSAAIFITLVYLVIEISQNTAALQAAARQDLLAADQLFTMDFVDSPELEELRFKPELTDEEKTQLNYLALTFMRMRENAWLQYTNGALDGATWLSYRGAIPNFLGSNRMRQWWQGYAERGPLNRDFVAMVDELLADEPLRNVPVHALFDFD